MVNPGQDVREGQPLGLVGSSGESTGSHLHFAVRQDGIVHEPHAGPCRTGDSLWRNQAEYVYDEPVELFHAGMTTGESVRQLPLTAAGCMARDPGNRLAPRTTSGSACVDVTPGTRLGPSTATRAVRSSASALTLATPGSRSVPVGGRRCCPGPGHRGPGRSSSSSMALPGPCSRSPTTVRALSLPLRTAGR